VIHLLARVMLLGAIVAGCGPSTRTKFVEVPISMPAPTTGKKIGDQAPGLTTTSPRGVRVEYPVWLDLAVNAGHLDAALAEIDSCVPETDARIAPGIVGTPLDTKVVILDPGAYYAPGSPTGLAGGQWSGLTIYVAWRTRSTEPRLPALAHELRHRYTRDPLAGH